MRSQLSDKETEPLVSIIESQVIPCWERFGKARLAVTAKTLQGFNDASPPLMMQTSVKNRVGKKVTTRSTRSYNNTGTFLAAWPEDNQAIFRYPTLTFVLDGQADFHVGDYMIHCPQDHFLLFASGVPRPLGGRPHFEDDDGTQRKCAILWFFAPPGTNSVIAYVCHSEGTKHWGDGYRIVYRTAIQHLYQLVIEELENQAAGHKDVSAQLFESFLHLFLGELHEGHFHRSGHSSTHNVPENSTSSVEQAQQYIKTHLNHCLTADKVAEFVYMSRSSFLQHFKRESGQTFHAFVTDQRMQEAGRLLSEGYWSINYVCQHVGLRPTQFSIQFKKRFGVAPSEFRRPSIKKHKTVS